MAEERVANGAGFGQGQIVQIDEERIRGHLSELVRGTVEETLNAMLEAEAEQQLGASKLERTEGRGPGITSGRWTRAPGG